jgi:malonyl-CoA/methylmalonyl-CoA synthetase
MIFLSKFDNTEVIRYLPRATIFMGVPTYYVRLLADPAFSRDQCAAMRLFVSGSAPLLGDTFAQFAQRSGHSILERYGMSETAMLTSNPYEGKRKPGTVGPALPGVSVRVVNTEGVSCASGEVGEIQVKGPNVFQGYWQMPEKTAEEFTDDAYFKTGDVGCFDKDLYLTIVGRSKDLIITGGYNVYPKEIEAIIDELPGILESAVIGVPHPDFGEAVIAVVVPRAGAAVSEQAITQALKNAIANFKVPKQVHVMTELPRNAMGKVQKNLLRQQFSV